jgi:hypothetical protein
VTEKKASKSKAVKAKPEPVGDASRVDEWVAAERKVLAYHEDGIAQLHSIYRDKFAKAWRTLSVFKDMESALFQYRQLWEQEGVGNAVRHDCPTPDGLQESYDRIRPLSRDDVREIIKEEAAKLNGPLDQSSKSVKGGAFEDKNPWPVTEADDAALEGALFASEGDRKDAEIKRLYGVVRNSTEEIRQLEARLKRAEGTNDGGDMQAVPEGASPGGWKDANPGKPVRITDDMVKGPYAKQQRSQREVDVQAAHDARRQRQERDANHIINGEVYSFNSLAQEALRRAAIATTRKTLGPLDLLSGLRDAQGSELLHRKLEEFDDIAESSSAMRRTKIIEREREQERIQSELTKLRKESVLEGDSSS